MKHQQEATEPAQRAAERHERDTQHRTTDLWNDEATGVEGKCCYNCDWIRHNVEPRKKPNQLPLPEPTKPMPKKTLKAWEKTNLSLTDYLAPCDEIDEHLYDHMGGVVSPQYLSRTLLQSGEASFERNGVYFYMTFQVVGDKHFYLGELPEFKQD